MTPVAVLFARSDSIYKSMPGCDVFDIDRDARTWQGGTPIVAHPPCRAWGKLRNFAKPRDDERALGTWAVDQVRTYGGVLEHPAQSTLWLFKALPAPGHFDLFRGFTLPIQQNWWGHRAEKATWLYVVGVMPTDYPTMPMVLGASSHKVVSRAGFVKGMAGWRPEICKAEREHTPPQLATWLVELARRCVVEKVAA